MSNVTIVRGNLFAAPVESIICHAVNCKGVWGAGIALQFAKKFPWSYKEYQKICASEGDKLLGTTRILSGSQHMVGCLFTSVGFGSSRDSEENILKSTRLAINDLISKNKDNRPIYMCKINSGLFGVPWEETQKVLESFCDQKFVVYDF